MNTKLLARARKARRALAPPPKLSLIEWADSYRQVAARTSATPGQWRTSTQPAAYGPMAAISEPDTHTVSIMAGTQILKSEVLLCTPATSSTKIPRRFCWYSRPRRRRRVSARNASRRWSR